MPRKMIDCRAVPSEIGCTLTIAGQEEEVLDVAIAHAVARHGHDDTPQLGEQLRSALTEEPALSAPGAFAQLIEFDTDRIAEWDAVVERWAAAIGAQRTARWSLVGADRDQPGRHVAVVEFPGYAKAMANSGHPATEAFLKELQSISSSAPRFRNLDVRSAQVY